MASVESPGFGYKTRRICANCWVNELSLTGRLGKPNKTPQHGPGPGGADNGRSQPLTSLG